MRIAILGGTGDIGEGLAPRLARDTDHSVVVGSRKAGKAHEKAEEYTGRLSDHGSDAEVLGEDNETAAAESDVVVAGIPPEYVRETVESLDSVLTAGKILVSPAVSMRRDGTGFHYDPPEEGSVAASLDEAVSAVPVVGAYQNLAAGALSDLTRSVSADIVLTGDDADAKATVAGLTEELDGLRPLDGGGIANSAEVESVTPLLINLATNNDGMHDLGVRFE